MTSPTAFSSPTTRYDLNAKVAFQGRSKPFHPQSKGRTPCRITVAASFFVILAASLLSSSGIAQQEDSVVSAGSSVSIEFTLTLADGTVVESNVDREPLTYVHGEGRLLPALEAELAGMSVDERKSVELEAEDAFGPVKPEAFREVPIDNIPEGARTVGTQLSADGFDGPIRVHEVRDETIVLDFNNPLAGKDLTFDVRIVSIE